MEALDKRDTAIFRESVVRGASLNINGTHGGNIFHLMVEKDVPEWKLIKVINEKGVSLNAVDQFGNTPLQFALLMGQSDFAGALIDEGAELNIKNRQNLSALHLAAFLNNKDLTEKLLKNGALIDFKGNAGYTPLHIASEMDHLSIAKILLTGGAKGGIKTDQKLTPKKIAKLQENYEMAKLLVKNGPYSATSLNSALHFSKINSNTMYPEIDFNLPYQKDLIKKRRTGKIIQVASIPVFVLSTAGAAYLRTEANNYYSLYKRSESEETAKLNYDKTRQFDTYSYISAGISVGSMYSFVHTTIWRKKITNRMRKTFK